MEEEKDTESSLASKSDVRALNILLLRLGIFSLSLFYQQRNMVDVEIVCHILHWSIISEDCLRSIPIPPQVIYIDLINPQDFSQL